MTKDEAMNMALEWAYSNGETVFAGGGMKAVDGMNAWTKSIREVLAESEARRKEFSETTKRNMEHVEWYLSTHAPEPVAWRYLTRYPSHDVWTYCASEPETKPEREPLYITPPQRPWVGLTDEEMRELWENKGWYVTMFKAVEAKLKEKNHG